MAANVCGWGTSLYGKRDFRKDGSYITTEWVILAFIPIIPMKSLRVIHLGSETSVGLGVNWESKHKVIEILPVNRKQMAFTYAYASILLLAVWFSYQIPKEVGANKTMLLNMPLFAICWIPRLMRGYARKKMAKESDAKVQPSTSNQNATSL